MFARCLRPWQLGVCRAAPSGSARATAAAVGTAAKGGGGVVSACVRPGPVACLQGTPASQLTDTPHMQCMQWAQGVEPCTTSCNNVALPACPPYGHPHDPDLPIAQAGLAVVVVAAKKNPASSATSQPFMAGAARCGAHPKSSAKTTWPKAPQSAVSERHNKAHGIAGVHSVARTVRARSARALCLPPIWRRLPYDVIEGQPNAQLNAQPGPIFPCRRCNCYTKGRTVSIPRHAGRARVRLTERAGLAGAAPCPSARQDRQGCMPVIV